MANNLMDKAVGILVAAVLIGAVAIPVVSDSLKTEPVTVTNETFNATSDPYYYEVAESTANDFRELDSVTVYDSTSQTTELTASVENDTYIKVEGTVDGDLESANYDYLPVGYINNSAARLVVGFVVVGLAIGLFVASFSIVR